MISRRTFMIGAATALTAATLGVWALLRVSPIPEIDDVWVPENVVVLDSAQTDGSPKAFVFQYDIGAFGYSITMASLDKPSHLPPFLLLKGSAESLWWVAPDTLMVAVTSDDYELSRPAKGIVVIPTHVQRPR